MGDKRGAYNVLMGRPEGKKTLGRPNIDGDNIKMELKELGWEHGLY
jgi:hypothetical protein